MEIISSSMEDPFLIHEGVEDMTIKLQNLSLGCVDTEKNIHDDEESDSLPLCNSTIL